MISFKFLSSSLITAVLIAFSSSSQAAGGEHEYHGALFLGATASHGETHATLGADIEKRLNENFGAALFVDSFVQAPGHAIFGIGLVYHPAESWKLILGTGTEYSHHTSSSMARVGVGYDWYLYNGMTIGPSINNDVTRSDSSQEYGLAFGYGF